MSGSEITSSISFSSTVKKNNIILFFLSFNRNKMNATNYYPYLDLSDNLINTIKGQRDQNINERYADNYKNSHIVPKFRYYKDDKDLNYTPQYMPSYIYKTKSLFGREKPSQTEHDEIGINDAFLNIFNSVQ